jgi:putative transposase
MYVLGYAAILGPGTPPRIYKRLKRVDGKRHAREINFSCFQDRPFLRSERACTWFVESAVRAFELHDIAVWAYVLMPTHVHMIVFPRRLDTRMANVLASLKRSVAEKAIRWTEAHAPGSVRLFLDAQPNGTLTRRFWQRGGGYDRNLWSTNAIWDMINHVHNNPVEAGLSRTRDEWRWSSAAYYETQTPGPIPLDLAQLPMW